MDLGGIVVISLTVLVVGIFPLVLSSSWRLMAAMWLVVFQIYTVPVHGFYPSLAFLCSIGLWPEFIKHGKELLRWRITQYYFLLLAVQMISLTWSPDIGKGARLIALMIPFAFILAATIDLVVQRRNMIVPLLYGVMVGAVLEAALVICLHLMPHWEKWFISSSIAHIFINPNSFSTGDIQVPKNWSGFLINPNTAAGYLGITSLLAQAIAFRYRQWWMVLVGFFLVLGVIFTGSTAGIILVGILYGTGMVIFAWPQLQGWSRGAVVLLLILIGIFIFQNSEVIAHIIGSSWTDRVMLWNFGLISFPEHPLRGLGFGGWELAIQEYVKQMGYPRISPPPHNVIITLWAQSGLFAALFGILFILNVLIFLWRSRKTEHWREFVICATLAMVWYFVHQQGANWGLLNERHIMPIAALLIGIVYAFSRPLSPHEHDDA